MLTTILAPTAGRFWIAGRPHTDQIEIRRAIGVLPESAGYPQHWTGEEYLRFYARLFGYGAAAAKDVAQELLGEVSLRDRGSSRIGVYSRGMRQRLGVAAPSSTGHASSSSTSRSSASTPPGSARCSR